MPDHISVRPTARRSFNIAALNRAATVRPQVKFKFKLPQKKEIFATDLRVGAKGNVRLTALRNPAAFGKIVPKHDATPSKDANWACSTTDWSGEIVSRDAAILNPNFHLMYPGATYEYASIANGSYKALPYARKPITVSVDGVNFSKPAVTVAKPSQASVRTAISQIKGSQRVQGGTRTFGTRFEVLSEEDLMIRTGGSGYFLGFGGSHQFDFGSKSQSRRYFIDVAQAYYTVSVDDTVNEPTDFFFSKTEKPADADALDEAKIDPNWVFVESVTYGRLLQVMIESDESLETVGLDIEAHAEMIVAGGKGTFNMDQRNLMKKTKITVTAIGGRGEFSGKLVNCTFDNLAARIDAFFSGTDDEVPISYGLRTLDGALVGTRMTTEFTSRQCAPVASRYKVVWNGVLCLQSDDQGSSSNPEDTKLFVRIRAWDGHGNEILDVEKKNNKFIMAAEMKKKAPGLPQFELWTFEEGSEQHPVSLLTGKGRDYSHRHLTFPVPVGDKAAKIGIRADVLEFDDTSGNDDFADEAKTYTIAEIGSGRDIKLLCTHDNSSIQFNFHVAPVFD